MHRLVSWPPLIFPLKSHFTGTKIHENITFCSKQGITGIDKAAKLMKTINFLYAIMLLLYLFLSKPVVSLSQDLCPSLFSHTYRYFPASSQIWSKIAIKRSKNL